MWQGVLDLLWAFAPFREIASFLTIPVSLLGAWKSSRLFAIFMYSDEPLAAHNRAVALGFTLIFLSTLFFSFGVLVNLHAEQYALGHIMRLIAFVISVVALTGLVRQYYKIKSAAHSKLIKEKLTKEFDV